MFLFVSGGDDLHVTRRFHILKPYRYRRNGENVLKTEVMYIKLGLRSNSIKVKYITGCQRFYSILWDSQ